MRTLFPGVAAITPLAKPAGDHPIKPQHHLFVISTIAAFVIAMAIIASLACAPAATPSHHAELATLTTHYQQAVTHTPAPNPSPALAATATKRPTLTPTPTPNCGNLLQSFQRRYKSTSWLLMARRDTGMPAHYYTTGNRSLSKPPHIPPSMMSPPTSPTNPRLKSPATSSGANATATAPPPNNTASSRQSLHLSTAGSQCQTPLSFHLPSAPASQPNSSHHRTGQQRATQPRRRQQETHREP